jgi:hypothetical protein
MLLSRAPITDFRILPKSDTDTSNLGKPVSNEFSKPYKSEAYLLGKGFQVGSNKGVAIFVIQDRETPGVSESQEAGFARIKVNEQCV